MQQTEPPQKRKFASSKFIYYITYHSFNVQHSVQQGAGPNQDSETLQL